MFNTLAMLETNEFFLSIATPLAWSESLNFIGDR
jgi:hypothetical protein